MFRQLEDRLNLRQMKPPQWMITPVEELTEFPIAAVARQLGALCRYCAGTPEHYSVARHSLVVAALLPRFRSVQLLALLHDAHECWTNDIPRPVFHVIGPRLKQYQGELDTKLFRVAGLDPTPLELGMVKEADDFACKLEMAFLDRSADHVRAMFSEFPIAARLLTTAGNRTVDALLWRTTVSAWMLNDGTLEGIAQCDDLLNGIVGI